MPSPEDLEFKRTVTENGLMTEAQMLECLEAQTQAAGLGVTARLSQIAVNKGYLSPERAKGVAQTMDLASTPMRKFGNYEILGKVGQGGMGVVYKARQVSLDRTVALKLLPAELSRNREYLDRFARESRAVAKLNHTNIIQVHDAGEIEGRHYFAMEFVDGESVGDLIEREGPLPEGRAIDITIQMARALEHAQTAGLIHRDIKPHNIMLTTDGVAKLADLGLAKSVAAKTSVAHTDNIVGTPHYMSPEQIEAEQGIDVRSDIYSLGATLYHMVTGVPPFGGATYATVLYQHMNKPVPDPRDRRAAISDGLAQVIYKMMAKKPGDRYQTPRELFEDLLLLRGGRPPALAKEAPSEGAPEPSGASVRVFRPPVSGEPAKERTSLVRAAKLAVPIFLFLLAGYLAYRTFWRGDGRPVEIVKGTVPTSVLTTVPAVGPGAKWETQLQQILAYERQDPRRYAETIRRLTALASDASGTEVAKKARERLQAVEQARDAEGERVLQNLERQAEMLARQEKMDEVAALFSGFPEGLLTPSMKAKIAEAKGRIARLQAPIEPVEEPRIDGLVVRKTLKQFLDELLKLTRARKFEEAKQLCEEARQQEAYKAIAADIRLVAEDIGRAEKVYALAEAQLAKKIDKVVKMGDWEGKVISVQEGKVVLEPAEGIVATQPLVRVAPEAILQLALGELDPDDPQTALIAGVFRLLTGLEGAKTDLERVSVSGLDVKRYETIVSPEKDSRIKPLESLLSAELPAELQQVFDRTLALEAESKCDRIRLINVTANGAKLKTDLPVLEVRPGERFSMEVDILVCNSHDANAVFPVGFTQSWGDPDSSFYRIEKAFPPGDTRIRVNINAKAPDEPGYQFVAFAGAAVMTIENVMSVTFWKVRKNVWNDGNDIARLSWPQIRVGIEHGWFPVKFLKTETEYEPGHVGGTAVILRVHE